MKKIGSGKYYSIGEISKITNISISTLRFYDRENILVPSVRSDSSGYRYYSEKQMDELHNIKYLQSFGFSLEEIKRFRQNLTSEGIEQQVIEKIKSAKSEIQNLENRLHSMEFLLNRIQQSKNLRDIGFQQPNAVSIEVTTLQKIWVISTRHVHKLDANLLFSDRCLELQVILNKEKLFPAGPYIAVFHGGYEKQFTKETAELELCIPIIKPEGYESKYLREFGGDLVISTMHHGHYRDMKKTYDMLILWAKEHAFEITGPAYEYYFCDLGTTLDEAEYLTKICFPIKAT